MKLRCFIFLFIGPQGDVIKNKTEEIFPDKTKNIKVTQSTRQTPFIVKPHKYLEISKHRANIKEILRWSNATPIRRYEDTGYMCCYCNERYIKPANLKKHTLETHNDIEKAHFFKLSVDTLVIRLDITLLRCRICKCDLESLEEFMQHLKDDHHKTIYTDIKIQITPLKFVSESLQCCVCNNAFASFKLLLEHMNLHYRNYICKVCDTGFTCRNSLRNHMQRNHGESFRCSPCSIIFNTLAEKIAHVKTVHLLKYNSNRCGYCNEYFKDYKSKQIHLAEVHGTKLPTYKCQACDKVFQHRKPLTIHVKKYHLLERLHKCSECDMKFYRSNELTRHMVKHTGLRKFKCSVCSKGYSRKCTLREHMKIHNNVRRFKCEHCGQAFVQKCSWRGHMKSKHEEIV